MHRTVVITRNEKHEDKTEKPVDPLPLSVTKRKKRKRETKKPSEQRQAHSSREPAFSAGISNK